MVKKIMSVLVVLQATSMTQAMMTSTMRRIPNSAMRGVGAVAPSMMNGSMGGASQPYTYSGAGSENVQAPQYSSPDLFDVDASPTIANQVDQSAMPQIDMDAILKESIEDAGQSSNDQSVMSEKELATPAFNAEQFSRKVGVSGAARAIYGTPFNGVQKRAFSTNAKSSYIPFRPKSNNPYDVLGVLQGATKEQIAAAYKKLAKQYHPDRNPEHKEQATQAFAMINNAYDQLKSGKSIHDAEQASRSNSRDDNDSSTYRYNYAQQQYQDFSKYTDITQILYDADFNTIMSFIRDKKYTKYSLNRALYNLVDDARRSSWWKNANEFSPHNLNAKEIFELIKICVQAGADVNSRDRNNYTILRSMLFSIGNELTETNVGEYLLDPKTGEMKPNKGPNYLYLTIKYLLDQGIDVKNVYEWNDKPKSALYGVAIYSHYDQPLLIDMLIQHGDEVTPEIVAAAKKYNKHNNNAEILKSYVSSADPRYWFK